MTSRTVTLSTIAAVFSLFAAFTAIQSWFRLEVEQPSAVVAWIAKPLKEARRLSPDKYLRNSGHEKAAYFLNLTILIVATITLYGSVALATRKSFLISMGAWTFGLLPQFWLFFGITLPELYMVFFPLHISLGTVVGMGCEFVRQEFHSRQISLDNRLENDEVGKHDVKA